VTDTAGGTVKFVTQFIADELDVTGGAVAVKDGLPIGFSLLEILAAIDRGEQRRDVDTEIQHADAGGPLTGITVTNTYDGFLRRSRLETLAPNSQLLTPST
jgi:hypothetical protein